MLQLTPKVLNLFFSNSSNWAVALVMLFAMTSFRSDIDSGDFTACPTLFNIERSRDANQIVYKLNIDEDGSLNETEPIQAFWVKYKEKGKLNPFHEFKRSYHTDLNSSQFRKVNAPFILQHTIKRIYT